MRPRVRARSASRSLVAAAAVVALVLLAGCRVETTVAVSVRPGGDGTVTVTVVLDHDAASRAGNLGRLLQDDDLRKAGWTITGPSPVAGGGERVTAVKPFGTPAQAQEILASITGPGGPLRNLSVSRKAGFASTAYAVRATVDLHGGVDAFGDPAFVRALGGTSVAAAAKALARPGDPSVDRELGLRFAVTLPGGAQAAVPGATRSGRTVMWDLPLGARARTISASSQQSQPGRVALAAVAAAALLAALVVGVIARGRGKHRRKRR